MNGKRTMVTDETKVMELTLLEPMFNDVKQYLESRYPVALYKLPAFLQREGIESYMVGVTPPTSD